uniref:Uncharacterized protein n=1 Tax=Arundo donax TaxID=35708 RepID=A0A0A9APM5_ARUDO
MHTSWVHMCLSFICT